MSTVRGCAKDVASRITGLYTSGTLDTGGFLRASLLGRTAALRILLLFTFPDVARSQDSTGVQVGARIRVKPAGPGQGWLTGSLLELPGDSVRLLTSRPREDSVAVSINSLTAFERSRGVRSRPGKGALIGLGTGAALGFVLGLATFEECTSFCVLDLDRAETAGLGALFGGLFGTGLGALFGATVREDRWMPVQQPWGADSNRP